MTFAETADHYAPRAEDVVGPYSPWPRRRQRRKGRALTLAIAALGVMVYCGVPIEF